MTRYRRVQRVAKRRTRPTKPQRETSRLDRPALDLGRRTYLSVRQAMDYLDFPSEGAVYTWVWRSRIPKCRRGGRLLFLRRDLDRAVQQTRQRKVA